jgi:hypothetical protein
MSPYVDTLCRSGRDRGCRAVGELRLSQRRKGSYATPPLCQGLRHHRGQGGPIIHVVQLTLPNCCLTSRMKVHFSGSAHLDGSYGNTSRGSPSRPLQPLPVPPSPERSF